MKKQYLTGNKAVDARRKAAQKMRTKSIKKTLPTQRFTHHYPVMKKHQNEGVNTPMAKSVNNSLAAVAKKYNAPLGPLRRIYNKGLAAWSSGGHRPGASQHGWAMARVKSVLKGGKARSVDSKEWAAIQKYRAAKKSRSKS